MNIIQSDQNRPAAAKHAKSLNAKRDAGDVQALVGLIETHWGIRPAQLFHRSRCRADVALTRQIAMYMTHVMLGHSLSEVGLIFGRDRTTVSHACARVEDMRDEVWFETQMSAFEGALEQLLASTGAMEIKHAA